MFNAFSSAYCIMTETQDSRFECTAAVWIYRETLTTSRKREYILFYELTADLKIFAANFHDTSRVRRPPYSTIKVLEYVHGQVNN